MSNYRCDLTLDLEDYLDGKNDTSDSNLHKREDGNVHRSLKNRRPTLRKVYEEIGPIQIIPTNHKHKAGEIQCVKL